MFVKDTTKSQAESESSSLAARYPRMSIARGTESLGRISLALVGACSAASAAIVTIGERLRVQRVVANGPVMNIESLKVREFEYIAQRSDGSELRIPRWESLCVPPPDDGVEQGSITPERVVLEWPNYLPAAFAVFDQELVVAERYYIVMPAHVETID